MAVKNIKARLEGSYRLIRIKKIKTTFFIIQLIIALALSIMVSFLLGMNTDPLYFPLDYFTFIFLILVLIMSVESVYFKGLEIKYTRNKSRKFLLARNAIRRSAVIVSICGLLVLMLLLPYTHDYALDTHRVEPPEINVGMGNTTFQVFDAQDKFGLLRASSIEVSISEPCEVDIMVVSEDGTNPIIYDTDPADITAIYNWGGLIGRSDTQSEFILSVSNEQPVDITLDYEVTYEISPFITTYLPAMGLAFIIVQFIAITILYPIRETYASSSIYSKKYVAKTEAGEYSISSKMITQDDKEEQALLDSTLDLETPTPVPKAKKAAPPPEDVEMARAKGKVDDDLIDEEDVECVGCGELNSAHSAICFSCGDELLAGEKRTVDTEMYLKKGISFASAGKYDDAITCYDEILKHDNAHEKTLVQKGLVLHRLGKWGSAVQYINTALKLNPNNIEGLLIKAEILESRDRLDKSMEIYSQILTIDPDNSMAQSKMTQVSEDVALENVEDILEQFMCIPGVGLARATTLYDAGFTSTDALKKASEDQLAAIKGISKGLAKKIKKEY